MTDILILGYLKLRRKSKKDSKKRLKTKFYVLYAPEINARAFLFLDSKRFYNDGLRRSQLNEDFLPLENFICDAILKGFNILARKSKKSSI